MTALKNQYVTLKPDIYKNNAILIYLMFDTKKGLLVFTTQGCENQ